MRSAGLVVLSIAALMTSRAWAQESPAPHFPEEEIRVMEVLDSLGQALRQGDTKGELELMTRATYLSQNIPLSCLAQYKFLEAQSGFYARHQAPLQAIPLIKRALEIYFSLKEAHGSSKYYHTETIRGIWMLGHLAGLYVKSGHPDSALVVYRKVLDIETSQTPAIGQSPSGAYNNIGWAWAQAGNQDSSLYYHRLALELEFKRPGGSIPNLIFAMQDNIALALFELGRYEEALTVNQENAAHLDTASLPLHRRMQLHIRLANCCLKMGDLAKAHSHLQKAESEYYTDKHLSKEGLYPDLLLLRQDFYHATGHDRLYLQTKRKREAYADSVRYKDQEATAMLLEQMLLNQVSKTEEQARLERVAMEHEQNELRTANEKAELRALLFLLGGILVVTMLGAAIFVYRARTKNQIRKKELERTKAELEKHRALERMAQQGKDLTNLSLYLSQVRGMNQELADAIVEFSKRSSDDVRSSAVNLLRDIKPKMVSGEKTAVLSENVEKTNSEFFERLKAKFPHLTPSDLEFCGFLLLRMSSKEIANIKNIQPKSVKMTKYRLRKKLGIDSTEDIYEWIAAQ